MRAALSAGVRRWLASMRLAIASMPRLTIASIQRLAATRRRPTKRLLAAATALLALSGSGFVVLAWEAASDGAEGDTRASAPGPGGPGGSFASVPTLTLVGPLGRPATYRIVGCRSRGASAYLHGSRSREVAIGFDDGPSRETGAFVRMLERARAPATFFVIGNQLTAGYRATLLRELRDGDVIGDHSYTHPDLVRSGDARPQMSSTIGAIRSLTGYTPCVFRPPYGAYDQQVVRTASALGLATVMWNDDPSDWSRPGTAAIVQRVLNQVQPGSIIISHDGGGPRGETLAAYPRIIQRLHARGYAIVTIPDLLGFRPVYVPCVLLCEGIGRPRRMLPRDAIIERAPGG